MYFLQGLILLYTMRPAIKNSAPSRHRRQLRSSAHPSSASSATLLPSHESASDDDSDDDDCSSRSRLNTVPLLSEDYGDDLATRYEATVQQARYREEVSAVCTVCSSHSERVMILCYEVIIMICSCSLSAPARSRNMTSLRRERHERPRRLPATRTPGQHASTPASPWETKLTHS